MNTFLPAKRWITGEIIHAIQLMESVRKKMKKNKNNFNNYRFKELRRRVEQLIINAKIDFFSSLGHYLISNPKRTWSVFKFASKKCNIPNRMSSKAIQTGAPQVVCSTHKRLRKEAP